MSGFVYYILHFPTFSDIFRYWARNFPKIADKIRRATANPPEENCCYTVATRIDWEMDDFFSELLGGIANGIGCFIGGVLGKLLFTREGLITVAIVAGLGVPTWYYVDLWTPEAEARTAVKSLCRENWNYYRKYGRMPNSTSTRRGSSTYGYKIIPTPYSNIAVVSASAKKSNLNNFVGITFGPAKGVQVGYACAICKSNSPSNKSTSPVSSSNGVGCPKGYRRVETLD